MVGLLEQVGLRGDGEAEKTKAGILPNKVEEGGLGHNLAQSF